MLHNRPEIDVRPIWWVLSHRLRDTALQFFKSIVCIVTSRLLCYGWAVHYNPFIISDGLIPANICPSGMCLPLGKVRRTDFCYSLSKTAKGPIIIYIRIYSTWSVWHSLIPSLFLHSQSGKVLFIWEVGRLCNIDHELPKLGSSSPASIREVEWLVVPTILKTPRLNPHILCSLSSA